MEHLQEDTRDEDFFDEKTFSNEKTYCPCCGVALVVYEDIYGYHVKESGYEVYEDGILHEDEDF